MATSLIAADKLSRRGRLLNNPNKNCTNVEKEIKNTDKVML